ncbi:MAG: hypothetical protein A3J48_03310 [Candidatus Doudnabacteria bacterium RIFCSPHIGHO2_02_FULL_46_11]|uniref:SCP domain-containing protein n=1 Tax=Candidatus Doudnabacteria bacterium RIFCSPHIGHO2_02_FULL_46_11 TaxID=1817832 RepID=A0A1F5P8C7_9BACT|nr:MAG: hypothetical protein A3J48_03310 [Candidatus Doudnabacteria bacterium RIFCSPHIGHO2_02_FULL_46_11]
MKNARKSSEKLIFAIALWLILLSPLFLGAETAKAQNGQNADTLDIPSLIKVLNQDRAAAGIHPLRRSPLLERAANLKAADMVAAGYFAHTSPLGFDPWHWFRQANYEYIYAGENLALDFDNAEAVEQAWMESPKHRENILSAEYEEVGYAITEGTFSDINGIQKTRSGTIIVQLFGRQSQPSLGLTEENFSPLVLNLKDVNQKEKPATLVKLTVDTQKILNGMSLLAPRANNIINDIPETKISQKENFVPPDETWPFVSLGLVILLLSAGIQTKMI